MNLQEKTADVKKESSFKRSFTGGERTGETTPATVINNSQR